MSASVISMILIIINIQAAENGMLVVGCTVARQSKIKGARVVLPCKELQVVQINNIIGIVLLTWWLTSNANDGWRHVQ